MPIYLAQTLRRYISYITNSTSHYCKERSAFWESYCRHSSIAKMSPSFMEPRPLAHFYNSLKLDTVSRHCNALHALGSYLLHIHLIIRDIHLIIRDIPQLPLTSTWRSAEKKSSFIPINQPTRCIDFSDLLLVV